MPLLVAGQTVRAQAGGFYGGWVTDEIVGPYKGEPVARIGRDRLPRVKKKRQAIAAWMDPLQ